MIGSRRLTTGIFLIRLPDLAGGPPVSLERLLADGGAYRGWSRAWKSCPPEPIAKGRITVALKLGIVYWLHIP